MKHCTIKLKLVLMPSLNAFDITIILLLHHYNRHITLRYTRVYSRVFNRSIEVLSSTNGWWNPSLVQMSRSVGQWTGFGHCRRQTQGKTPDQGFHIKIPGFGIRKFPNVVFEVAIRRATPVFLMTHAVGSRRAKENLLLCVIIFVFRKPSSAFNFSESSKWKAFLEVYERYGDLFTTMLALSHRPHQEILRIVQPWNCLTGP